MSTKKIENSKKKFSLSENIRSLRKNKNLSLEQLARKLNISLDNIKSYETNNIIPPLEILINMSNLFNVSMDFLIKWNKTGYARNIKFLNYAKIIDKLNINERYKIEGPISSFIDRAQEEIQIKMDNPIINITDKFNENIRQLRLKKGLTQKQVADQLNISSNQIAFYENNKSTPPADKLIKLSETLDISIHALVTGELLHYNFDNKSFQTAILKADKLLSLEYQNFLIELMEAILPTKKTS